MLRLLQFQLKILQCLAMLKRSLLLGFRCDAIHGSKGHPCAADVQEKGVAIGLTGRAMRALAVGATARLPSPLREKEVTEERIASFLSQPSEAQDRLHKAPTRIPCGCCCCSLRAAHAGRWRLRTIS